MHHASASLPPLNQLALVTAQDLESWAPKLKFTSGRARRLSTSRAEPEPNPSRPKFEKYRPQQRATKRPDQTVTQYATLRRATYMGSCNHQRGKQPGITTATFSTNNQAAIPNIQDPNNIQIVSRVVQNSVTIIDGLRRTRIEIYLHWRVTKRQTKRPKAP